MDKHELRPRISPITASMIRDIDDLIADAPEFGKQRSAYEAAYLMALVRMVQHDIEDWVNPLDA